MVDHSLSSPIQPPLRPGASIEEPPTVQTLINKLGLQKHPEGGYFVETDREPLRVPNPFLSGNGSNQNTTHGAPEDDSSRSASTTIYYLLTPGQPHGVFHRNKGRTMHTLHRGPGRYIVIHVDEKHDEETTRIESFFVGHDIHKGERLQCMVEGKTTPMDEQGMCCSKVSAKGMLLIQKSSSSEVVDPGDSTIGCASRRTPQEKCRTPTLRSRPFDVEPSPH